MLSEAAEFPVTAICLRCSYSLRSLPEHRCPECGHPFNPADLESFWDTKRPRGSRWIWKRWAKPPSALEGVIALLAVFASVVYAPGSAYSPDLMVFTIAASAFSLGLLVSCAVRQWALQFCYWCVWNRPERKTRSVRTRWGIVLICAVFSMGWTLGSGCAPRFFMAANSMISRPLLLWKAKQVLATRQTDNNPGLIGCFYVERVIAVRRGVVRFDVGKHRYLWLFYTEDGNEYPRLRRIPPGTHWRMGDLDSW